MPQSPWEQLDIEESALSVDEYAGLGHNADHPGWYGGKIEFRGKLQKDEQTDSYKIVLERCTLGPSCRFTRRFGSRSFLRVKIPSRILHSSTSGLIAYFRSPFVIWGRIFRAFYAKDDIVFLFRTNEIYDEQRILPGHFGGFSLLQFIEWHNPLQSNRNQVSVSPIYSSWLFLIQINRQWPNGLLDLRLACLTLSLALWLLPKISNTKMIFV